ncbi:ATP-binding protein [Arenibaculum pallidiluteum]|uniref:ATP-binding protein n=1 Tax=Arenibaculum pallidiluteum TaxID=2812559 RepID=UPI001A961181|nr:ATP-binding protein [Arenibaculum pallidiluteum]
MDYGILVEALRLVLLVALLAWLVSRIRSRAAFVRPGWGLIMTGAVLVVLSAGFDLAGEVLRVGARPDELLQFLNTALNTLGCALVCVGIVQWIPTIERMHRDGDERCRALDALGQKLAALDAAPDGIGLLDEQGRFTYANPAVAALYGAPSPAALAGRAWTEPFAAVPRSEIDGALSRTGLWTGALPGCRPDGAGFLAEARIRRLADGGHVCVLLDITAQARLREQMLQAQKLEAIGRVAGGFAHDFNNILAAMMGYATFLAEDLPGGTDQNRFSRQILASGEKARDLVEQILVFSARHETGRRSVDLGALLARAEPLLRATLHKSIVLELRVGADDATVAANSSQVNQILVNLCLNAADVLGQQGGRVTVMLERLDDADPRLVRLRAMPHPAARRLIEEGADGMLRLWSGRLSAEGPHLLLSVADDGPGMERAVLDRLFEPFFTTRRAGEGTGLGLAAVHGIVASLGGAILVETAPGRGARFDLVLPAGDEPVSAAASAAAPGARGRESVLVVDDEERVGAMLSLALERLGYEVASCVDADEALDAVAEDPSAFDLVLTDQRMPGLTGVELAARLAALRPEMPVVICTGFSPPQGDLPSNIRAIVAKPVDFDDLARRMRAALDAARA